MKNNVAVAFSIFIAVAFLLLLFGCTSSKQEPAKNQAALPAPPSTLPSPPPMPSAPLPSVAEEGTASEGILPDYAGENNISSLPDFNETVLDPPTLDSRLQLYYFYSPLCFACNTIKPKVDSLESKYNSSVRFERYSVLDAKQLETYNNFTREHNVSRVVPIVYVANKALVGMFEINDSLEGLIINATRKS